jgi:NifU-like protein involved in Fe-S cluster formation
LVQLNNVFDYPAGVWTRFRQTPHAGRFDDSEPGVTSAQAGSVAVRSLLRMHVKRSADGRARARFQAYGCPTAIAVGEWLCEQIEARGLAALAGLKAPDIRQALEMSEDRIHCALMGEDVLTALQRTQ